MSAESIVKPVAKRQCPKGMNLEERLACLADGGGEAINARLCELDSEWSAGRVGKAVLGTLILVGFALAAVVNPYWLVLPAVAGLFLLQNLFQRTAWFTKAFEEAGFRSSAEIEKERMALKALRGDFRNLPTVLDIESHEDITRLEGEGGIVVEPDDAKVDPRIAVKEVIQATNH